MVWADPQLQVGSSGAAASGVYGMYLNEDIIDC